MVNTNALLREHLESFANAWSVGVFGAIAEFMYDDFETVSHAHGDELLRSVSPRGGISLAPIAELRAVAFEAFGNCADGWSQGVAFCLPQVQAALPTNHTITDLGRDTDAIKPGATEDVLFDLGIGSAYLRFCIRSDNDELTGILQSHAGEALFEPGNQAFAAIVEHSPDRVGISRVGRIEVYQPIPSAHGETPAGPHTHLLPKLLSTGRTHSASTPIPAGWVPCFSLYPDHPMFDKLGVRKPFDQSLYDNFQGLLGQLEGTAHLQEKQRTTAAVLAGTSPQGFVRSPRKWGRLASRVALRQLPYLHEPPAVYNEWLERYDRGVRSEAHEVMPGEGPVGEAA
jgi:hypothetical protein